MFAISSFSCFSRASLVGLFGFPRGLLATLFYCLFIIVPRTLFKFLLYQHDMDVFSEIILLTIRFTLADQDIARAKFIFDLLDQLHYKLCQWKGFTLEPVEHQNFTGLWVAQKKEHLPSQSNQHPVMLWIHGGGFCSGSSSTFLLSHATIISKFNEIASSEHQKPLVYFCVDYTLAPQATIENAIKQCESAFHWLHEEVGVQRIFIGGDSAGGNLAIQLMQSIGMKSCIAGCLLVSPWLDLSMTYPSKKQLDNLCAKSDFLTMSMLRAWAECAIFGTKSSNEMLEKLKKEPKFSPLFSTQSVKLPAETIVCYGTGEVFAPSINEWCQRHQAMQKFHIIKEENMPHDYVLMGSLFPIGLYSEKSRLGLHLIAQTLYSLPNLTQSIHE